MEGGQWRAAAAVANGNGGRRNGSVSQGLVGLRGKPNWMEYFILCMLLRTRQHGKKNALGFWEEASNGLNQAKSFCSQ